MIGEAFYYSAAVIYLLGVPLFATVEMYAPWLRGGYRYAVRIAMGFLWPAFLVGWLLFRGIDNLRKLE